jgi:hypothetical protein
MNEQFVTFAVLEDELYRPSVGAVLPMSEYRGRCRAKAAGWST